LGVRGEGQRCDKGGVEAVELRVGDVDECFEDFLAMGDVDGQSAEVETSDDTEVVQTPFEHAEEA
jgi:hypothetical protein